ncbi:PREDICTED: uncharacterized protein LOC108776889 isoform X2 [Cyphomyrmex costatus]|uniref:uncharacterized protein LOC108776889 isoform X2 n=1 Tax=Cyphomyrmex costatus TaxID=456900 RepID=UPI0008522797|nr:PREDICTED: uncharacterized protein LOC108776889 isoform X2 [Cyphomyrmex costatus]
MEKMSNSNSFKLTHNFYIIEFDDGIALVPNNWLRLSLSEDFYVCFYPNYDSKKKLNKAIQTREEPDLKNVQAGWAMYDILHIIASADTFERGQEKLKMAENISDVNTDNEEKMKQTRHDRAVVKNFTSDDSSSSSTNMDSVLLQLPDPNEFCGSHYSSNKILATYENAIISPEDENIMILNMERKKPKIVKQEKVKVSICKKMENNQDIDENNDPNVTNNNDDSIDWNNKKENQSGETMLKEILKKVNRILVEITYIERRLSRLENKTDIANNEAIANIAVEEVFVFDTISSVEQLHLLEENLKKEDFFMKMNFLKLKGGINLQDRIKNCFKTLIKDEILMLYSWKGARGKNAFRNFKIVSLIIAVIRLHDTTSTEEEISKLMINWIVQAPSRVKRIAEKERKDERDNLQDHQE